jgi:hypothetical protein
MYRRNVERAEQQLAQTQQLYAQGLVQERDVQAARDGVSEAKVKAKEVEDRIAVAERQIANELRAVQSRSSAPISNAITQNDEHVTKIIASSENHFRKGKLHLADNKRDQARDEFDRAVDLILESGLDVRFSARLQTYYQELVERIYREEVPLGRTENAQGEVRYVPPVIGFSQEKFEPSPLDELSKLVLSPDEQNSSGTDTTPSVSARDCDAKVIKDAQLRGFRLGMTLAGVRSRLPQLKVRPADAFGYSEARIYFTQRTPAPSFLRDVLLMVFNFIDGHVTSIGVVYDNSIKWRSLEQFTHQVSGSLQLPTNWRSYDNAGNPQRILECRSLRFVASMVRSQTSLAPALFLVDNAEIDKLIARRVEQRERARKADELRRQKQLEEEEKRRKAFKP